ncbi:MAG TPA: MMPL family transporter [Pseudogracilibacillus sp.]|nr:MMPL family transporter [Pseudogracilibacillus sp.]
MKGIIRFRWLIIVAWIAVAGLLTVFTPDLQALVAEKGAITVPDGNRSVEADHLLEQMSDSEVPIDDLVLVFRDEAGVTEAEKADIVSVIEELEANKERLEIRDVIDFSESEDVAESTVSEDGTTILVPIEVALDELEITELRDELNEIAAAVDVPHAITGEALIEEDIIVNSEEGLTKTIYITVVLILIILFAVFRSFIAPIIPLLTVGVSYLVAEGIVSVLADTTAFPLSTFTQIFMVSIMFGIGTDYCILIISRFKEEMNAHETIPQAVVATYKASGKTVFYAALAVFIGFSTIGLSQFSLYQSAVAVAVGVFVVTIALVTIVPFFLVLLGRKLFWPFDKQAEHKESKLWGALGHFTWTRPVISLLIVALVTVPVLLIYKGDQTYDNLAELDDSYDTVIGFDWIEQGFGPGEIMPITVVMELEDEVDTVAEVQGLETITSYIADLDGISKVRSVSRPAGDIIDDFLLETQTDILTDGLDEMMDGIREMQDGLDEASTEMKDQAPELDEAKDGVQELIDGTRDVRDGINEIQVGLAEIEDGLRDGSVGLGEAIEGLGEMKAGLQDTIDGHRDLLDGYEQVTGGLVQADEEMQAVLDDLDIDFDFDEMVQALDGVEQSIDGMIAITDGVIDEINENLPEGMEVPDITDMEEYQEATQTAKAIVSQMKNELENAEDDFGDFDLSFQPLIDPLEDLNAGYKETIDGQQSITDGFDDLIAGLLELENGLDEAADGQGQIADGMPEMSDGLAEMIDGQEELKDAFDELQDGLDELADGLGEAVDGLDELHDGLDDMNRYLTEMDFTSQEEIVVIPKDALEEDAFWEGADLYLSPDRKIVKFEAILDIHPYSKEALLLVDDVEEEVKHAIDKTRLDVVDFKIGGISSMNNDLDAISAKDYARTATLMLIGIFIILVFMLRSIVMPLYILASLLLTYYTSIGITEFIFINIAGQEGLTWAIPFFSFVMLIALGVDYSIFLMSRFNEYKDEMIYNGMMKSMRNMGTVIISATVILGGTFAAMLPAGVLSLLQIASVVIIGLALYALIILPLFTPVFVKLFGKYNWWPFHEKKDE